MGRRGNPTPFRQSWLPRLPYPYLGQKISREIPPPPVWTRVSYVHGGGNLQAKTELLNRDFWQRHCPSKSYSGHDLHHFGRLSSGLKGTNILVLTFEKCNVHNSQYIFLYNNSFLFERPKKCVFVFCATFFTQVYVGNRYFSHHLLNDSAINVTCLMFQNSFPQFLFLCYLATSKSHKFPCTYMYSEIQKKDHRLSAKKGIIYA